jgi:hypothetical protein
MARGYSMKGFSVLVFFKDMSTWFLLCFEDRVLNFCTLLKVDFGLVLVVATRPHNLIAILGR